MSFEDQIQNALKRATKLDSITLERPKQSFGDYAFACFQLAKMQKKSPIDIAKQLASELHIDSMEKIEATGPYVNFFVKKTEAAQQILANLTQITKQNAQTIIIESPSPNTNKPLHLGHLRNMLLGQSLKNILHAVGHNVKIVNLINDRGVHICKSMFAYQLFGKGQTPKTAKIKSDHLVGDYYVKYAQAEKDHPEYEQHIQQMLVDWENGDKKINTLWKKMNSWALKGHNQTYKLLGFEREKDYYESQLYMYGKDLVQQGLEKGVFFKDEKGSIVADLEQKGLGKKVLLRSNGTSVYITQDLYLAKVRYDEFQYDRLIYVVGNEQEHHFNVLFNLFELLGFSFAKQCYHFSYGMVELPEGKMKSREGNVVDTDELFESVQQMAYDELHKRYPTLSHTQKTKRAKILSHAAIRFFFLKQDPVKNFVFNPKESLSFEGETAAYVQYAYARISSIERKAKLSKITKKKTVQVNYDLLHTESDRLLLRVISQFNQKIQEAAMQYKPSIICHYALVLASAINDYYRDVPILKAESEEVLVSRLYLLSCAKKVIKELLQLLGIQTVDEM